MVIIRSNPIDMKSDESHQLLFSTDHIWHRINRVASPNVCAQEVKRTNMPNICNFISNTCLATASTYSKESDPPLRQNTIDPF